MSGINTNPKWNMSLKQTDQAFFILPTKGAKKEVYAMIPLPKATPTIAQNVLIVANRLLVS